MIENNTLTKLILYYSSNNQYNESESKTHESNLNIIKITQNHDIIMKYDDETHYKIQILDDNAKPVAGGSVKFTINDETIHKTSNSQGYVALKITLAPGTYTIQAEYDNFTVINKIIINTHFKSKKKVIYSRLKINKKGYLQIKYKIGKQFVNKKITLNFKGKKFIKKVAKNGHVTFKISKNIVKKLKTGKKYKYKLKYKLDTKIRYFKVTKKKLIFTS